jgi:hypothetical protein
MHAMVTHLYFRTVTLPSSFRIAPSFYMSSYEDFFFCVRTENGCSICTSRTKNSCLVNRPPDFSEHGSRRWEIAADTSDASISRPIERCVQCISVILGGLGCPKATWTFLCFGEIPRLDAHFWRKIFGRQRLQSDPDISTCIRIVIKRSSCSSG